MQLIDLHIPLRRPLRLGIQVLAHLLSLDHEGRQDRTGCRRAPNAARRKRIPREGVPDARLVVTWLDLGDENGRNDCGQRVPGYANKIATFNSCRWIT